MFWMWISTDVDCFQDFGEGLKLILISLIYFQESFIYLNSVRLHILLLPIRIAQDSGKQEHSNTFCSGIAEIAEYRED